MDHLQVTSQQQKDKYMSENNAVAIKRFFEDGSTKINMDEFKEFWESLSEPDKEYYRNADLG